MHPVFSPPENTSESCPVMRLSLLVALVAVCHGAKEDERDCEGAQSPLPLVR